MRIRRTDNIKVKNATPVIFDNIHFESRLEKYCYMKFKEAGLTLKYEPKQYTLLPKFSLNTNLAFYCPKKKSKKQTVSPASMRPVSKFQSITYTPDFYLFYKDYHIIIETKGMPNDAYPIKRKLFLNYLNNQNEKFIFLEPHNYKQIDTIITLIQNL